MPCFSFFHFHSVYIRRNRSVSNKPYWIVQCHSSLSRFVLPLLCIIITCTIITLRWKIKDKSYCAYTTNIKTDRWEYLLDSLCIYLNRDFARTQTLWPGVLKSTRHYSPSHFWFSLFFSNQWTYYTLASNTSASQLDITVYNSTNTYRTRLALFYTDVKSEFNVILIISVVARII